MARGQKTGGRQAGTPNKLTASAKEAMEKAFNDLGGVAALTAWAKNNQTEFYKLWARVLPTETTVKGTIKGSLSLATLLEEAKKLNASSD